MESSGMALFAYTLLSYLALESPEVVIHVGQDTNRGSLES
jgi:hypothetical protein